MRDAGFCKKHQISYGSEGCPDCAINQANKPYKGMQLPSHKVGDVQRKRHYHPTWLVPLEAQQDKE